MKALGQDLDPPCLRNLLRVWVMSSGSHPLSEMNIGLVFIVVCESFSIGSLFESISDETTSDMFSVGDCSGSVKSFESYGTGFAKTTMEAAKKGI